MNFLTNERFQAQQEGSWNSLQTAKALITASNSRQIQNYWIFGNPLDECRFRVLTPRNYRYGWAKFKLTVQTYRLIVSYRALRSAWIGSIEMWTTAGSVVFGSNLLPETGKQIRVRSSPTSIFRTTIDAWISIT